MIIGEKVEQKFFSGITSENVYAYALILVVALFIFILASKVI